MLKRIAVSRWYYLLVLLLALLAAIGGWIFYKDIQSPSEGGFEFLDGLIAALYWFALMIYVFLSVLLSYSIRQGTWKSLVMAHGLSVVVAASGALLVLSPGYKQASKEGRVDSATISGDQSSQRQIYQTSGKDWNDLNRQLLIPIEDD